MTIERKVAEARRPQPMPRSGELHYGGTVKRRLASSPEAIYKSLWPAAGAAGEAPRCELARAVADRLSDIGEKMKPPQEALAYNALVWDGRRSRGWRARLRWQELARRPCSR
jgi:hypothetical protein